MGSSRRAKSSGEPASAPGGRSSARLTAQQRLFAHEYLVDRNGTQAAIRAGYSARSAGSMAGDLLKKPEIRSLVDRGLEKLTEKTEVKVERVLLELHRILLADPVQALQDDGALRPLSEWPEDLRRAISSMEIEELFAGRGDDREQIGRLAKVKFWSKTESAQQLLRVLGAFAPERVEVKHSLTDLVAAAALTRRDKEAGGGA
jgi:phage terminase small subunit